MNAARPLLRGPDRRVTAWLLVPLALARPGAGALPMPDDLPSSEATLARPLVTGRHGVVTALHPLAAMAGMRILLQGGNAFDAAAATAMAIAVVDPKNSTIGGQGFATVYVAREKRVRGLNFFGPSPGLATVAAVAGRDYSHLATCPLSKVLLAGYAAARGTAGASARRGQPRLEPAEEGSRSRRISPACWRSCVGDGFTTQAVFFSGAGCRGSANGSAAGSGLQFSARWS